MVLNKKNESLTCYVKLFSSLAVVLALGTASDALGYTYLAGGKGLKRDANGHLKFYRSEEIPTVKEKGDFENGIYANSTDEEIYNAIADRVAALWNSVPGKFYTLEIVNDKTGTRDKTDIRNSITLFSEGDNTGGGDATPVLDSKSEFIEDCDIRISRTLKPEEFGIVLTHEIGHCLGLGHEQKDLNAIMSYNRNKFRLTLDDAAGAASIYPEDNAGANSNFQPCGAIAFGQLSSEKLASARVFQMIMLFLPIIILLVAYRSKQIRRTSDNRQDVF